MRILGINAYHGDSSAALVVDGQLVAAVEEERFNRIKHWAGLPVQSIRYCLESCGLGVGDLDHIAVSFNPRANVLRRLGFVVRNRPSIVAIKDRLMRQRKMFGLKEQIASGLGTLTSEIRARVHFIEHHQTHVAAGFLISPFDKAAVLSVDGMGDFTSTLTAMASGCSWKELSRVHFPHSLGFFYTAVTMYLGFPHYGDEYKVMGLAPYGEPEFIDFFRKLVRPVADSFELNLDYFTHHRKGVKMKWENGAPSIDSFYSQKLVDDLGPARNPSAPVTQRHEKHRQESSSCNRANPDAFTKSIVRKNEMQELCMTGGVAMNSVANGKITTETPFENVYVPAGAADNGTSFGAAFYLWNRKLEMQESSSRITHIGVVKAKRKK